MLDRLSIRARLTIAFAAALFLVLVSGVFVYQRSRAAKRGARRRARGGGARRRGGARPAGDRPPRLQGGLFEGEEGSPRSDSRRRGRRLDVAAGTGLRSTQARSSRPPSGP